jgi:hypothetical protein
MAICPLAVFLLLWLALSPGDTYSLPVYSPNRKMAARVRDCALGPLLGDFSEVELFSAHGFKSQVIVAGDLGFVEPSGEVTDLPSGKNLRWTSDSELEVTVKGRNWLCTGTPAVKVRCVPRIGDSQR